MRLRYLPILVPLIWILATALTLFTGHPWTGNRKTLDHVGQWIERFHKDQVRLPLTLAELRTYAYSYGERLDIYDNFGERLAYVPLDEEAFYVKSFGRDKAENTVLRTHDESYSRGFKQPPEGLKTDNPDDSRLNIYQSMGLEGSASPEGPLYASIYIRFRGDAKRLLVRSKSDPQFFMTPFPDRVDEFLWMPGGYELVFTAQGSDRYEDGIYYWNLKTNVVRNLLPKIKEKYFPRLADNAKFLMSLSHVSKKPTFIYAFIAPQGNEAMGPKEFYRYGNFFALNPREDFSAEHVSSEKDYTVFEYGIDHRRLLDPKEGVRPTPAQNDWLHLQLQGDAQTMLESWQAFCSNRSSSPALPYALWWLASIYNDTYRDLSKKREAKARTIRNFGLEIVEALTALPSAPRYLQGFAEYLKKNLQLSKPADYNVAAFNEGTGESSQ